jgi:hypothetical protein
MTLKEYYKEILSERTEQLDELSDDLMKRYLNRATSFTPGHSNSTTGLSISLDRIKRLMTPSPWGMTKESDPNTDEFYYLERRQKALNKKLGRREKGINRAKAQLGLSEEGKLATTPKEKKLAALHGDPNRITRGDVIKGAKKAKGLEESRMKNLLKGVAKGAIIGATTLGNANHAYKAAVDAHANNRSALRVINKPTSQIGQTIDKTARTGAGAALGAMTGILGLDLSRKIRGKRTKYFE